MTSIRSIDPVHEAAPKRARRTLAEQLADIQEREKNLKLKASALHIIASLECAIKAVRAGNRERAAGHARDAIAALEADSQPEGEQVNADRR